MDADVTDSSGNTIAAADPDASNVLITLSVANGTLSLGQTNGLSFQIGDGLNDASMSFSGTLADINAALDSLAYQSGRGFVGKDTLNVVVDDQGGTGDPGSLSTNGTIDIVVGDRSGDVLFNNGTLIVGNTGIGSFSVVGGQSFSAFEMIVGNLGTGDGTVLIDGSGGITSAQFSEIVLSDANQNRAGPSAIVGREGRGDLRVLGGADLRIDGQQGARPELQIGQLAGSDGTVVVSGVGSSILLTSAIDTGYIAVGRSGAGRLEILDGATVQNAVEGTTVIGGDLTSRAVPGTGTVLIEGNSPNAVSTLSAGARLVIGMEFDVNGQPMSGTPSGTGTLIVGDFGAVNAFEAFVGQNGRVEGTGTLNASNVILDGGTLAPGFSAGTLNLSGNLTVSDGSLEMELGGTSPGLSDLIDISGQADIQGGLVDFSLIGRYLPAVGDSVVFLTTGDGFIGSPVNLSSAVHGVTADFDYRLDFTSSEVSFVALSASQVGNSTIFHGGALDDVYAGGNGDDVLRGGTGADALTGGAGSDVFVLAPGDGGSSLAAADILTDFVDGTDFIGLAGGLRFSDLTIRAVDIGGSAISVTNTGEFLAFVEGVAPNLLDTDDFTIVM
jgi:T5SS/PEP-CTERM-associated repeat protein